MTVDETDKIKLPFLRKYKDYYFLFDNTGEAIMRVLLILLLNRKMGLVHNPPCSVNVLPPYCATLGLYRRTETF